MVAADKYVEWTKKARSILGLLAQDEGAEDNLIRKLDGLADAEKEELKTLLHFGGPRKAENSERRLETRTVLALLVGNGWSITDAGKAKDDLYAMKAADLTEVRTKLAAVEAGGAAAPQALEDLLGKDSVVSKLLLEDRTKLDAVLAKLPNTQASADALVAIERSMVDLGDRYMANPGDGPMPDRILTVDRHDAFFRRKTDILEEVLDAKLKHSKNPKLDGLKAIPDGEMWKILIDGSAHGQGDKHYFDRSKGYMASMVTGLNKIVDDIDKPVTVDFIKELHTCATSLVTMETRIDDGLPILSDKLQENGLKKAPNSWGVCKSFTATGMAELKTIRDELDRVAGMQFFSDDAMRFKESPDTVVQWKAGQSADGLDGTVTTLMAHVIGKCYVELASAASVDAKIGAIVDCCRGLGVIHPFRDANGRVMMFLLLNKLLLEQGLQPTTLSDQGLMVGRDKAELVRLIKAGQASLIGG